MVSKALGTGKLYQRCLPRASPVAAFHHCSETGGEENGFILRATVDSDLFNGLVAAGPDFLKAETFIVNRDGMFQTRISIR